MAVSIDVCFHPFVLVCCNISLPATSRAWSYAVQGLISIVFDDTADMSGANQNLASLCRVLQRLSVT